MPEETSPTAVESPDSSADKPSIKQRLVARFGASKWLGLLIVTTVAVQLLGLWYVNHRIHRSQSTVPNEIGLGHFQYVGDSSPQRSSIAEASFDVHIRLLDEVKSAAQARLESRRFKVQQDIEQLLRQAHGGDFEDPTLAELKRQFQELINQSLDMHAVSEVIITDLSIDRVDHGELVGASEASDPNDKSG